MEIELFYIWPCVKKNYTYAKLNCFNQDCLAELDS